MDEKKTRLVYIKWFSVFILLYAAVIVLGIRTAQRDAQREAERKYEFNIIQSIIENLAAYQDEIENWGYSVSVLTFEEEPENEAFLRYHWNHCSHPVLFLTDADGGIYCFYYGFDGYTSTVSYLAEVEHTDAIKTVSLELFKRELYQAPYWENPYDADKGSYYDIKVAVEVAVFSIEENEEIWAWSEIGRAHTNYCSNNFVDCKYFGGIDPDGANQSCDYRIKREYSAEQLLAFYRQGLDLQERLIELYQSRFGIAAWNGENTETSVVRTAR